MGKTYKDKANHFLRHSEEEIPKDVQEMVKVLDYTYCVALRYGNQRKMRAKAKIDERRSNRRKNKKEVSKEINIDKE